MQNFEEAGRTRSASGLVGDPYIIGDQTYDELVTHRGTFHADEVYSTALLLIAREYYHLVKLREIVSAETYWKGRAAYDHNPKWDDHMYDNINGVIRTQNAEPYQDYNATEYQLQLAENRITGKDSPRHHRRYLIYDIGRGEYDHHQEISLRPNGVPYASFGLLWKAIYKDFDFDDSMYDYFDRKFVQPIDLNDNTGSYNGFADLVKCMNPQQTESLTDDDAHAQFNIAVFLAYNILLIELGDLYQKSNFSYWYHIHALSGVERYQVESDDELHTYLGLVFDEKPDIEILQATHRDVAVAIYPASRGGTTMHILNDVDYITGKSTRRWTIPNHEYSIDREGHKVVNQLTTGKDGCRFIHKSGFMATFDTTKDAQNWFGGVRPNDDGVSWSTHVIFTNRVPSCNLTYDDLELDKSRIRKIIEESRAHSEKNQVPVTTAHRIQDDPEEKDEATDNESSN